MFSLQRPTERRVTVRHPRRSFTLIELLMVIVIISILMSLALAAYSAVMLRARVAEVKVEVDGLSSALADFKAKFGFYPPSRIVLVENPSTRSWRSESRSVIRRMFPQFDFTLRQDINGDGSTEGADLNGDGTRDGAFVLTGAECLVFFLGGVQKDGIPIGFSNNPARPFSLAGSNRLGPFFGFDAGRVSATDVDNDGMKEYVSPLSTQTLPYLYASSYNGRGYRNNEIPMTSVYRQRSDDGPSWKPKSFQIICPGFDDKYGVGGKFDPETAELELSPEDHDNITNFHTGMLAP